MICLSDNEKLKFSAWLDQEAKACEEMVKSGMNQPHPAVMGQATAIALKQINSEGKIYRYVAKRMFNSKVELPCLSEVSS